MGVVRLALAALLVLQPALQAAELAPVDVLLTRVIPQDTAALAASGPEKGERLAKLQSDLSLVAEGLEGFASEGDAAPSLKRLRESVDATAQFKERASALDAAYRALAVVDYTWAKRLPEAPCSPEASRARLLKSGALSSWIAALLGPGAEAADAVSKLDQASAAAPTAVREYALLRAKIRRVTEALGSEKAVGSKRASLYCRRAEAYEALSAANRAASGPINASRANAAEDASGVYVLARRTADGLEVVGAATAVEGALVTDGRLVDGEGLVVLRRGGKDLIPVRVERRDGSGLALLRAETPVKGYTLAESAPAKNDLINAIGHTERTGAWTRTRGLVTEVDSPSFQTDAVVDVGMAGGAALTEDGRLAGVFVLRPARQGAHAFDWPVAVSAPELKSWIEGRQLAAPSVPVDIAESGTASILTASRPLGASLTPGAQATEASYSFYDGNIRAVCKANCDDGGSSSGSSYSSNGGAELGQALGKAMAPVVEAMIFRGVPALFRGIGSLFKSKPKALPSEIAVKEKKPEAKQEEVLPKPKLTLTLTPAEAALVPGSSLTFTAKVSGNRKDLKLDGHLVEFSITDGENISISSSAVTDAAGIAQLTIAVAAPAIAHRDLDDESAKHPWLTNASRGLAARTACHVTVMAVTGALAVGATIAAPQMALAGAGAVVASAPLSAGACMAIGAAWVGSAKLACDAVLGKEIVDVRPLPQSAPTPQSHEVSGVKSPVAEVNAASKKSHDDLDEETRKMAALDVVGGQPADPNEPPEEPEVDSNADEMKDIGRVKSKKGEFLKKLDRVKTKGRRTRWKDEEGRIYEWDSQHGELEVYSGRGQHIGVRDPKNGKWIKSAKPGRTIEP